MQSLWSVRPDMDEIKFSNNKQFPISKIHTIYYPHCKKKKKKKLHITSSKHLKTEEYKNNNKLKKKPVHKHIGKISTAII